MARESRLGAKVDSAAAVQDGYDLYHHCFFFTPNGAWCVVQQGMYETRGNARRYHWLGQTVDDFVCEPHAAVQHLTRAPAPPENSQVTLNMVAAEAEANAKASAELIREHPEDIIKVIEAHAEGRTLFSATHRPVLPIDVNLERLEKIVKIVRVAHERHPQDFETLLGTPQVEPATIRSLLQKGNGPITHTPTVVKMATRSRWTVPRTTAISPF